MAEDEAGTIPQHLRPNVDEVFSGEDEAAVASFGEPEPETESEPSGGKGRVETYVDGEGQERYVGSNRRVRSDRGSGGSKAPKPKAKGKIPDPGAAGATVLYGGIGAVLSVSGLAPAAGLSMQGLADEAGPEISEWAKKRSPRFYGFLCQLSEASGIGKYVAAPVSAEAYLRLEKARPALGPAVVSLHGKDSAQAFDQLTEAYDAYKAQEAASRNGAVPPEGMDPSEWNPYNPEPEGEGNDGG